MAEIYSGAGKLEVSRCRTLTCGAFCMTPKILERVKKKSCRPIQARSRPDNGSTAG